VGRDARHRPWLVFSADADGDLVAVDARTGKDLWHFFMGSKLYSSAVRFRVSGKQYVSITAGTNLLTFSLFEFLASPN
jgi:hypothetical protein